MLQGKTLYWFKLEQQRASDEQLRKVAQNCMFMHRQSVRASPSDDGKGFPIQIVPDAAKEKPYELVAPSQYMQTQWVDALEMALRVEATQEELSSVENEAKKTGFFRRKLFGRKNDAEHEAIDSAVLDLLEAVTALDMTGSPVVVFVHAGTGRVNVVYRRSDGAIGWVDPPNATE